MYISCTYDVFYTYIVLVFCHIFLSNRPTKIHLYTCMHICYVYHTNIITQIFYVYHTDMMCIVIHTCITKKGRREEAWLRAYMCMCLYMCMRAADNMHDRVISHTRRSHVTHRKKSCHTTKGVMSHTGQSHVTRSKEFYGTHVWVLSHVQAADKMHVTWCMCHVTCGWVVSHVNESNHIWCEWVKSERVWYMLKGHVTCVGGWQEGRGWVYVYTHLRYVHIITCVQIISYRYECVMLHVQVADKKDKGE